MKPSSRATLGEQLADRVLGGEIGLADEIGGRALGAHVPLGAVARALGEQRAGHGRGLDRDREQSVSPARAVRLRPGATLRGRVGLAHENSGGRCCAHGRSRSICAASDRSVDSSAGRPTICTARGSPSEPKPAGTDAAGWPVTFQTPL